MYLAKVLVFSTEVFRRSEMPHVDSEPRVKSAAGRIRECTKSGTLPELVRSLLSSIAVALLNVLFFFTLSFPRNHHEQPMSVCW